MQGLTLCAPNLQILQVSCRFLCIFVGTICTVIAMCLLTSHAGGIINMLDGDSSEKMKKCMINPAMMTTTASSFSHSHHNNVFCSHHNNHNSLTVVVAAAACE